MKQKMKKALLVLCMAVCFLALSGCSAGSGNPEPIPPDVSNTMISGAEEYLREFAAFDETTLQSKLEDAEAKYGRRVESRGRCKPRRVNQRVVGAVYKGVGVQ